MPIVFIPNVGRTYRLTNDWFPELDWVQRNLVLLRNHKLTGKQKVVLYHRNMYDYDTGDYLRDENGRIKTEEVTQNRTVPNPLFRDDDGEHVPVTLRFPKDLEFTIIKFVVGYGAEIFDIWGKVTKTDDKRFTDRVFSVTLDEFNGCELEEV